MLLAASQHVHALLASRYMPPLPLPGMWCRTRMRQSMTCDLQETAALVLRAQHKCATDAPAKNEEFLDAFGNIANSNF